MSQSTRAAIMLILVALLAVVGQSAARQMADYRDTDTTFTCRPGEVYTTEECP